MPARIVVCCDGTWNTRHGDGPDELGPTNVALLADAVQEGPVGTHTQHPASARVTCRPRTLKFDVAEKLHVEFPPVPLSVEALADIVRAWTADITEAALVEKPCAVCAQLKSSGVLSWLSLRFGFTNVVIALSLMLGFAVWTLRREMNSRA